MSEFFLRKSYLLSRQNVCALKPSRDEYWVKYCIVDHLRAHHFEEPYILTFDSVTFIIKVYFMVETFKRTFRFEE